MNTIAPPTSAQQSKTRALEKPASKAAGAEHLKTEHCIEVLRMALGQAADTEESVSWSGDSDRLLRVAHELAGRMVGPAADVASDGTIANRAHTIAALVSAALQVPGDTPSKERSAFIEQARTQLVALTNDPTVLDGWETYPQSKTPARQTTQYTRVLGVIAVQADTLSSFLVEARKRAEGAGSLQPVGDLLMAQHVAEFIGSIADEACDSVYRGGPIAWAGGENA